ncbi:MAG TPA: PHB depolymerase family esterase [Thermoanaerobaculia bacterium]|jgi:polyhydroxybutyrate depolymerase|nr:PHB depolymerase family esterase [Thermoanaerobaculia bacterium]
MINRRRAVLGTILLIISLPAFFALGEAVHFYLHNRANGSIVSSGQKREYEIYVPRSYDRTKATPLVISMHGAGGWAVQQMNMTRWNRLADAERFIVVYPSGADGPGPRIWHVGREPELVNDVRFIAELIDKLKASYNIDPERIYANGFSNGGGMAFVLSCTLSDRIAAVGMVGAAQTLPWDWYTDPRPVPMISFHGTADPFAPYNGGISPIAPDALRFPDVAAWAAKWAARNRCASTPIESRFASGVTRREYTGCADRSTVMLFSVNGAGHQWFGGESFPEWFVGPASSGVDATSEMWAFFRAHPLRRINALAQ